MSPVSFGSTYKFNSKGVKDYHKYSEVMDFCEDNSLRYSQKAKVCNANIPFLSPSCIFYSTIISPDNKDNLVETYLSNNGIKFKKLENRELFDVSNIKGRISDPPKYMRLVYVDAKKLEKLAEKQGANIGYCGRIYDDYYKDDVIAVFKSGDKFETTTLSIDPIGESVRDTVGYIQENGADRLNEEQLSIMFLQKTDGLPQCMYSGMKDLGMDSIPVYVNNDTYHIADALGILTKSK